MKPFDLIYTPLSQSNLLEANAGTGKTYSLCFLYIRLLIEKNLAVDEILVTTFTVAATTELKSRVFNSLNTIKGILNALQTDDVESIHQADDNWVNWIKNQRKLQSDKALETTIRLALCQADKMQIYSIDALALLLLHEYEDVIQQFTPNTVLDNNYSLLKPELIALVQSPPNNIQSAISESRHFLKKNTLNDLSHCFEKIRLHKDKIEQFNQENAPKLNEVKIFEKMVDDILKLDTDSAMDQIIEAIHADILNKKSYNIKKIEALKSLIKTRAFYHPNHLTEQSAQKSITLLSLHSLTQKIKKNKQTQPNPFTHSVFKLFDQLLILMPNYLLAKSIYQQQQLITIADYLDDKVATKKAEQMSLTYQDIMDAVVNASEQITTPYGALLVDEAQDLNQQQLTLFNRLTQKETIVFFVGDPKQAIYGFRNSDINTYIQLKSTVDHQYLLSTNFRSTQTFNHSINTLFSGNVFNQAIPYSPIQSHLTEDHSTALHLLSLNSKEFGHIEQYTAELINYKLNTPFLNQSQTLKPSDIAILVRTKGQGKEIQSALNQLNIPSVFLDGRSIFNTPEASYFRLWLNVLITLDIKSIKTLMLSPLLSYPIDSLDDADLVNQLRSQLMLLQSLSLAHAFHQFNTQFDVIARLSQLSRGKTRLNHWLHIFELANQQATQKHFSHRALHEWLTQQTIETENAAGHQVRLAHTNAVSIMTMHKSKGLEFNVVCLPYADKEVRTPNKERLLINQKEKTAMMSFIAHDDFKAQIQKDQKEEQIRLLYVALTRAKYQNIVLVKSMKDEISNKKSPKKISSNSAWGTLTQNLEEQAIDLTTQDFTQQMNVDELNDFSSKINANENIIHSSENRKSVKKPAGKQLKTAQLPHWVLSSFSRLHEESKTYSKPYLTSSAHQLKHPNSQDIKEENISLLSHLPAGAHIGTAIHTAYEWLMQYREVNSVFIDLLNHLFNRPPLDLDYSFDQLQQLSDELVDTLTTPLSPLPFALFNVDKAYQSIEMRFFLRLSQSAKKKLSSQFDLVHKHHIETYLHGYIDYCFCHQGKFYIVDYKSNYLGSESQDYAFSQLNEAMHSHHYHLQALIYTIAICQWLNIDNPIDYKSKIGGAIYLFIRGMTLDQSNPQGIWHHLFTWQDINPYLS